MEPSSALRDGSAPPLLVGSILQMCNVQCVMCNVRCTVSIQLRASCYSSLASEEALQLQIRTTHSDGGGGAAGAAAFTGAAGAGGGLAAAGAGAGAGAATGAGAGAGAARAGAGAIVDCGGELENVPLTSRLFGCTSY